MRPIGVGVSRVDRDALRAALADKYAQVATTPIYTRAVLAAFVRVRHVSVSLLTLVGVTGVSWLALLNGSMRADSIASFIAGWLVMMTAMMLPAAMPMIMVFRLGVGPGFWAQWRVVVFLIGYLVVWMAFGLLAFGAQWAGMSLDPIVRTWSAVGALALAGAYQFSPLKDACLRTCRSPMDFVVLHWRAGAYGAVRLGVAHGVYCLGCCWALMAVLVVAGGMGLAWVAAIALVIFVERVLPRATVSSRFVGAAMLGTAAIIAVWPKLLPITVGQM